MLMLTCIASACLQSISWCAIMHAWLCTCCPPPFPMSTLVTDPPSPQSTWHPYASRWPSPMLKPLRSHSPHPPAPQPLSLSHNGPAFPFSLTPLALVVILPPQPGHFNPYPYPSPSPSPFPSTCDPAGSDLMVLLQGDRVGICVTQLDATWVERGIACTPGSVPTFSGAVAAVDKIRFFVGQMPSRMKVHVTIGHQTVMGLIQFFGLPDGAGVPQSHALHAVMARMDLLTSQVQPYICDMTAMSSHRRGQSSQCQGF